MYVGQGDILTFDNGMIGAVTVHGKVALVDPKGYVVHSKYQPLLTNYNAVHRIVRIQERASEDAPLETIWEDEAYDFDNKRFRNHDWTVKPAQSRAA